MVLESLFHLDGAGTNQENNNLAEVTIAKNRHGSTGTVKMGWYGQYYRFIEGTDEYDDVGEPPQ